MSDEAAGQRAYFRCHVFCCTNERPEANPRGSCGSKGSAKLRNYMKARAKELGLGDVRINTAGCLDRCELGPTMVIYPEGVWYQVLTFADVDEILVTHVVGGGRVEHLLMRDREAEPVALANAVGGAPAGR